MTRLLAALALMLAAALPARAAVEIQEVTSPGGITAWLVEEHSIPFTALEIRFLGGTSLDDPGTRGAIYLMTGLLEEGAADLDAQAFAAAREALAASFGFDSWGDALSVSAKFLTENRPEAVELLRKALVEPRFDQEALDRVRAQVISGLQSDATDPNEIAWTDLYRKAFGEHPYGSPQEGTLDTVAALTREDMVEAHRRVMARDRVFVSAVGDITPEDLGALLDQLLGGLPETGAPQVGDADYRMTGGTTVIDFDTPQSVAVFGHEGILRDDDDFFAAYVANEIFGGSGFQSRLMQEIRVKRGLTYGVGASLAPMDHGALIVGSFASDNDKMAEAIGVLRAEWEKIAAEGVTEAELDEAKTYLTGAYPLRFDGNGPIARILVGMQMQGLPIDYAATRNDKVNAVTLDDVRRVVTRIYRPEELRIVVVGRPEGLAAPN